MLLPSSSSPTSSPIHVQIHGIWFYEAADLERLSALLNRVKSGLPRQDVLPVATQQQTVWREVWGKACVESLGWVVLSRQDVPPVATHQV